MIDIKSLTKTYPGTKALRSVSLSIRRGEIFGLLGPNGAGKSTLLKSLVGLILPDGGEIRIDGTDLRRDPRTVLAKLGYVPQQVVFPRHQTVREVMAFYAELKGVPTSAIERALERVGLQHDQTKRAGDLSGGMRQRLGLAQSILADPPLLVLDEPSVGLDPHVAAEFRTLLAELNAQGTTIVLTSHLLGEVERLAHRVAILKDGTIAALDSIPQLLTASGLSSALWVKPLDDLTDAQAVLRQIGVPCEAVGLTLKIDTQSDRSLPILDALRQQGIAIERFWTTTPTLEEVFRRVVERSPV